MNKNSFAKRGIITVNCTDSDLQTDLNCFKRPDGMSMADVIFSQFTRDVAYSKIIVYHLANETIRTLTIPKTEEHTVIMREDSSLKEIKRTL